MPSISPEIRSHMKNDLHKTLLPEPILQTLHIAGWPDSSLYPQNFKITTDVHNYPFKIVQMPIIYYGMTIAQLSIAFSSLLRQC